MQGVSIWFEIFFLVFCEGACLFSPRRKKVRGNCVLKRPSSGCLALSKSATSSTARSSGTPAWVRHGHGAWSGEERHPVTAPLQTPHSFLRSECARRSRSHQDREEGPQLAAWRAGLGWPMAPRGGRLCWGGARGRQRPGWRGVNRAGMVAGAGRRGAVAARRQAPDSAAGAPRHPSAAPAGLSGHHREVLQPPDPGL